MPSCSVPLYYEAKLLLLVWMMAPQTKVGMVEACPHVMREVQQGMVGPPDTCAATASSRCWLQARPCQRLA